jgi:LEA14-like dessication related protein
MSQRLFVLLFALGLTACSSLPFGALTPKMSVADVAIKRIGLLEQHFDVGVRLSNPNDFDLTIEALEFELEVNGQPFAKGEGHTTTLIPALSSTVLRVDAIMQSQNLIQQIKTLPPQTLKDGVPYRIKGRVKTDKLPGWLPFDHPGIYGGDEKKPAGQSV